MLRCMCSRSAERRYVAAPCALSLLICKSAHVMQTASIPFWPSCWWLSSKRTRTSVCRCRKFSSTGKGPFASSIVCDALQAQDVAQPETLSRHEIAFAVAFTAQSVFKGESYSTWGRWLTFQCAVAVAAAHEGGLCLYLPTSASRASLSRRASTTTTLIVVT